ARVRAAGRRVVAVTFVLDGRPVAADTRAPWAVDVDASRLEPGRHRLRVVAVDRVGGRSAAPPVTVRSDAESSTVLHASPEAGFDAALAALARGHVAVALAPGRYPATHIELGTGARLVGAGERTVLAAARAGWSLVTVRGHGVRISDLTIDGGRRAERAIGVGGGSHDVRLQRLRVRGVRESAIEIWGTHSGVSVQDSILEGGGAHGAGVADLGSDDSRDTSVIRSDISGFRGYGINFAQRAYDRPSAARNALALDNRIRDIDDPAAADGTHEGGIWSGGAGAAIIRNDIRDTGWDGIQTVGTSRGVTVVDNDVARTGTGIYLEHETNDSLVAGNVIADVATGINVEWRYDGAGSSTNTFEHNTVVRPTDAGIFVDVAGDGNRIAGNVVVGGTGPAVVLQGASDNLVVDNRACERADERLIVEQSAHHDDGVAANSLRNRIARNQSHETCPGR
ncbi:MAG TPA: right-handed parallel beta-helix repeat-containing protein, partial [Solirubrobacteraceae bacterium]|nr:right-handed parallel beta-helix repeat-containing protein [Solirubrobacteraceae bacterium]